ncbi:MAG: lysylphosphatidylglycerol synthase domain-containing protein [Gemmatimonadota bacterium]
MSPAKEPAAWKRRLSLVINVSLFAIALLVLRKILTEYHLADIVASLHKIGYGYIAASVVLTVLGYASLVGYDYLSLRIAGHPIPVKRMWAASFISHAVQNSAPMAILAGGGLRYRLFSRLGVTGSETATVVAGNVLTFVIGLFAVAGLSFVIAPVPIPAGFHLPVSSLRPVGIVFLLLVAVVLIQSERGVGSVRVWRWTIKVPGSKMLLSQLAVSVADWLLSSTALYVLMIAGGPVSFLAFLSGFLLAQIVTQVIPLPGGVGVFEAAILLLRPPGLDAPLATAALLVYRVVYYLVPLFVATALLALQASGKEKRLQAPAVRLAGEIAPHLFAVLTFVTGIVLLVFTTLPEHATGFKWLGDLLRLAVIEGSHFVGSLVGMGLLLLAFGLERRLRSAFRLTVGLLLLGIPAALMRSLDFVSAAALIALLLLLLLGRREFNRTIPFNAEPINAGWTAAIVAAVAGIGWLGIYLQLSGKYTSSLWWRFALDDDAPRTLRVTLSVLVAVVIFITGRLASRARRAHDARKGRARAPSN